MKKKNLIAKAFVLAAAVVTMSCSSQPTESKTEAAQGVIENIMTRASVRQFTDRPISNDTLETIVRAGMAAPSAVNLQPWAFVVVTEREVLDSLKNVHPHSNLATATAAMIVCGNIEKIADNPARDYWVQDCSAATENILLAAHSLGIGAVWCGVYPNPERVSGVRQVLGLPETIIPLNIITMGYPAGEVQPKDKWNPDNVHYQRW